MQTHFHNFLFVIMDGPREEWEAAAAVAPTAAEEVKKPRLLLSTPHVAMIL